jgi:hypothetical protein
MRVALTEVHAPLPLHRLPHVLRDHGRIVVNRERDGALKSMRPRDEDSKPAIERIGGNPRFVRSRRVSAACDHGCLNALAAGGMARKSMIGAPEGRPYPQTNGWTFWQFRDVRPASYGTWIACGRSFRL